MGAINFDNFLKVNSSRHHYIPQFLINHFTDTDGLLYVYDKKKDIILKKKRPSKSIFFEPGRNTVELNSEIKSSILEDYLYREMDNKTSKVIKYFQTEDLTKIDFKIEDIATITFFLISLFWRIPKTDYAAEDLMKRSLISSREDPEILRQDSTYKKIARARLFEHHTEEMKKFGTRGTRWSNIHQNEKISYVIGDYPFLHKTQPTLFRKFNDVDLLFAVSSTRIYSATNKSLNKFTAFNSFRYNAAIIHQSVNYVACADLNVLTNSLNYYKDLTRAGLIYSNGAAFEQKDPGAF